MSQEETNPNHCDEEPVESDEVVLNGAPGKDSDGQNVVLKLTNDCDEVVLNGAPGKDADGQNVVLKLTNDCDEVVLNGAPGKDSDGQNVVLKLTNDCGDDKQTLNIDWLAYILEKLWSARCKWKFIGYSLNISEGDLQAIEMDCRDVGHCFKEMLKTWLRRGKPRPTKSSIANALHSRKVSLGSVANNLFFHCPCGSCSLQTFLKMRCPRCNMGEELPFLEKQSGHRRDLLVAEGKEAELRFEKLKLAIESILIQYKITTASLINAVDTIGVYAYKGPRHMKLSEIIGLREAESFEIAFGVVKSHMSFFNCDLLQPIIKELCPEDSAILEQIKSYTQELQTFCQRRVTEVSPSIYGGYMGYRNTQKLVAVIPNNTITLSLADVQGIKKKLAGKIRVKPSTISVRRVEGDQLVTVVLDIPDKVAHHLPLRSPLADFSDGDFNIKVMLCEDDQLDDERETDPQIYHSEGGVITRVMKYKDLKRYSNHFDRLELEYTQLRQEIKLLNVQLRNENKNLDKANKEMERLKAIPRKDSVELSHCFKKIQDISERIQSLEEEIQRGTVRLEDIVKEYTNIKHELEEETCQLEISKNSLERLIVKLRKKQGEKDRDLSEVARTPEKADLKALRDKFQDIDSIEAECQTNDEASTKRHLEREILEKLARLERIVECLKSTKATVKEKKDMLLSVESTARTILLDIKHETHEMQNQFDCLSTLEKECEEAKERFRIQKEKLQKRYKELKEQEKLSVKLRKSIDHDIPNATCGFQEELKKLADARHQRDQQLSKLKESATDAKEEKVAAATAEEEYKLAIQRSKREIDSIHQKKCKCDDLFRRSREISTQSENATAELENAITSATRQRRLLQANVDEIKSDSQALYQYFEAMINRLKGMVTDTMKAVKETREKAVSACHRIIPMAH